MPERKLLDLDDPALVPQAAPKSNRIKLNLDDLSILPKDVPFGEGVSTSLATNADAALEGLAGTAQRGMRAVRLDPMGTLLSRTGPGFFLMDREQRMNERAEADNPAQDNWLEGIMRDAENWLGETAHGARTDAAERQQALAEQYPEMRGTMFDGWKPDPNVLLNPERMLIEGLGQTVHYAPSLAAALLTKSLPLGLPGKAADVAAGLAGGYASGLETGGQVYRDNIEQGTPEGTAQANARLMEGVTTALSALPFERIVGEELAPGLANLGRNALKVAGTGAIEAGSETLEEYTQGILSGLTPHEALGQALSAGAMAGPTASAAHLAFQSPSMFGPSETPEASPTEAPATPQPSENWQRAEQLAALQNKGKAEGLSPEEATLMRSLAQSIDTEALAQELANFQALSVPSVAPSLKSEVPPVSVPSQHESEESLAPLSTALPVTQSEEAAEALPEISQPKTDRTARRERISDVMTPVRAPELTAIDNLERELGRPPVKREVAATLGLKREEAAEYLNRWKAEREPEVLPPASEVQPVAAEPGPPETKVQPQFPSSNRQRRRAEYRARREAQRESERMYAMASPAESPNASASSSSNASQSLNNSTAEGSGTVVPSQIHQTPSESLTQQGPASVNTAIQPLEGLRNAHVRQSAMPESVPNVAPETQPEAPESAAPEAEPKPAASYEQQMYEYDLNAYREIADRHREMAERYRTREVSDAEFLRSRRELDAASDRVDAAEKALKKAKRKQGPLKPRRSAKAVNDALADFRERVRFEGMQPLKDMTWEDFGGKFPPGIIKKRARLSWDQWAGEALSMGLLQDGYTTDDFRKLFIGKNTVSSSIDDEYEEYLRRRGETLDESAPPEPEDEGTPFDDEDDYEDLFGKKLVRPVDRIRARARTSEAVHHINRIAKKLSRGSNFVVLRSMKEAPSEVKQALGKQLQSVDRTERHLFVSGFFHEGKVYFVAKDLAALAEQEGLSVQAMAVAKWAHEYGLHYGLRGMLEELHGPGGRLAFKRLMRDVFAAVGREGILEAVGESYASAPNDVLAEEYLAHLAERLDKNGNLTQPERTAWQKVLDFFRNALRRTLGKLTDRDIERVVLNSLRWAMNRGETNGTPDTRFSLTFGHEFQDKQKDRSENTLAARDAALRVLDKGGSVMDAWRAARRAAQEADARPYSTEGIRLAGDHGMRQAARLRGIDIEDKAFGDGWNSNEPASAWDTESKQGAIFAERPLPKLKSARGQWKKYGEPRFSIVEARRQTETPAFKRWFGQSKVAAEDGEPLAVYHGTVNDFTRFDERRGNVESDWGAGFYFSNTPEDVNENYAGEGPDLTNKIERLAERIEAEEKIPYAEARERARAELSEGRANVMPVFLSLQNPFEVGGEHPEYWDTEYDPEDEDAEPTGKAIDFLEALRHVAYGFEDVNTDTLSEDLSEYLYDGGKAEDMVEAARKSEGLSYATDENGDLAGHEIIRLALERMGYDGIIDRSVNKKFGWESKQKPMLGMAQDTVHYIAFRANQIKSATGNTGAFDPTNPDIRFSAETRTGDPNMAPEAARRIEAGELASEPGKRGLANPLPDIEHLRQVYDTVQSVMDELGIPGVKRIKDTYAAAEEMDLAQVQSRMMEHARNGRTFETVEEAAAARLVLERESPKLLKENRLEELAKLIGAYNDTGTEAARILAIRRQQLDLDTPEAKRSALLGQLFEPSRRLKAERDRLTRQISQEKNPGKRAVLLRRRGLVNKQMAKELEKAKAILDRYGIDPERIEEAKPAVLRRVLRDVAASKHTYWDALFEWRMNWGLLSGGRSFVVDPLSTGMHAAWDATGERFVKAMLNLFVGDPLSPHMNELVTQWRGLVPGLAAGWRNAFRTLATEEPTLAASKGQKDLGETFKDRHDVAISGRKGYLVRLPSNLKAASDEFIKSVVAHMDVWAQADRLARLEGLKGAKRTQRIAELVGDGRSLAWTLALTHANYIAFQEPLKSEGGNKLMGTVHSTPLRWAFPFVKTPTNLVKLGLRKSPLGILSLVREQGKLSTEEKVTRTAEQLIAWSMTVGLFVAMSGDEDEPWITGTSSWTPEERNKREAEYRFAAPYTIKLPGYGRVDYSRLEPFSTALATTVDALDNFKHNGAGVEAGNEFMHDTVGLLKDKLFLRGMSDLMDLAMDERRRPKVAADFLSSFIPNLYQQAALASDPNVRELQDAGHGRFKDRVLYSMFPTSHIPYPKVDVWGREIQKGGNAPWRAAMPINLYPDQQSDLEHKLDTLIRKYNENAPPEKQWWPSRPQPFYTKDSKNHYWTDEEYHRLSALAGNLTLDGLRRARLDWDSPTDKDIERIQKALEEARGRARKEVRLGKM